jgi:hypothetical protein
MRHLRSVRRRQRLGALRDNFPRLLRLQRPIRQKIIQRIPASPLHHQIRVIEVLLHVVHLRQPGISQPAHRPRRQHHIGDPRKATRERQHGHRPG